MNKWQAEMGETFIQVVPLLSNGIAKRKDWLEWIMCHPDGLSYVNGKEPVTLTEDDYAANDWIGHYGINPISSDKLKNIIISMAYAPSTDIAARHRIPEAEVAMILAQNTIKQRADYYNGCRFCERNKTTNIVKVLEGPIRTAKDLAVYVANKYYKEHPEKYWIMDGWLLQRGHENTDQEGKPDCLDQPGAVIDRSNPKTEYDMDDHEYYLAEMGI